MKYLLVALLLLPLLASCNGNNESPQYRVYSQNESISSIKNIMEVFIDDNGTAMTNCANITNMSPGRTATVTYRIHNNGSYSIKPLIYTELWRNTADYKPEYTMHPNGIEEWLNIPEPILVQPGETLETYVSLSIPKDAVINEKKWKIALGVAPGSEDFYQCCASHWWFINMR